MSTSTFAFSETREDGFNNPLTSVGQKTSGEKLTEAIKQRHSNYFKNKIRNLLYKNRKNQKNRHLSGMSDKNVSQRSTNMSRTGALNSVPFYSSRREMNKGSFIRKNQKQVFRARAIDYYVDGGDANKEALNSGVIYGSQHKIKRVPSKIFTRSTADIKKAIIDVQKDMEKGEQVPTGYQKNTQRSGASHRNFIHPFMKIAE